MRIAPVVMVALLGCGQVAPTDGARHDANAREPDASRPEGPAGLARPEPPPAPGPVRPAGEDACGAATSARSFSTTDAQAAAVQGLWTGCVGASAPPLCPPGESTMVFDAPASHSGGAACGHLSSHGSSFIPHPDYRFTYEVRKAPDGPADSPYEIRLWNVSTDRAFVIGYREARAADGSLSDATLRLVDNVSGGSGALRHASFTTF